MEPVDTEIEWQKPEDWRRAWADRKTLNARVQADADSARLLMHASPFGVSMCNALLLIFFFLLLLFPGRGTGTARCS